MSLYSYLSSQSITRYLTHSTHPQNAEQNEGDEFYEVPGVVILHVEHHQMVISKRVEGAKNKSSSESTEKRSPQRLQWKVVGHLQTEENRYSDIQSQCLAKIPGKIRRQISEK